MCEFHFPNGNGLGDIWWTDKLIYFSIIDDPNISHACSVTLWYDLYLTILLQGNFIGCQMSKSKSFETLGCVRAYDLLRYQDCL